MIGLAQKSDNFRGAILMMVSQAAFVFNDAIMKVVSAEHSLFQIVFTRGCFTILLLAGFAFFRGELFFKIDRRDRPILALRVAAEISTTICFLMALFNMPIANSTAILQALPLAVTLGAAIFLGEAIGWRRLLAILIGFIGVLIIVRPGTEGFNAYSFWALAAVFFIVIRDLCTRKLSTDVPSFLVALYTATALTLTAAVCLPVVEWKPFSSDDFYYLGGAACLVITGYLTVIMAMRTGEISFVSPFRYTVLLWAILMGYLVFADIPDSWTLLGSAILVVTGIYSFYREHREEKKRAALRSSTVCDGA